MTLVDRVAHRLKLRDLRLFEAVVRSKSMARAAAHLNLTQPAVSKAVSELEHILGVRLLERSRQGIEPTPHGLALLRSGVAIFDDLRQGMQEIEFLSDPTTGDLRIGAIGPVIGGLLPITLDRLSRRYPRIVFHVSMTGTIRDLRERNVDLLLGRVSAARNEEDIAREVLFAEPMVVAVGSRHPLARRRKLALADLVDELWVLPRNDTVIGEFMQELFEKIGLHAPPATVVCNSLEMQHELLMNGRFVALIPASVLRFSSKRKSIKVLPVELPGDLTSRLSPLGVLTLKKRALSPVAQLFLEAIREIPRTRGSQVY
jgi:DNA-binding transcriptional LysR family regulator